MNTRAMKLEDSATVVDIHLKTFQGFFLSFLGPAFLSLLYRAIRTDPSGIAIVAEEEDRIFGFVAGSTQPSGLYQRLLKRHLFGFFWASLGGFIRKPTIFPRLLGAFNMPRQKLPAENCATLMSVGVDPCCQNKGIGNMLVSAFLNEARLRGSEHVNLTTDAVDNDSVNNFYQSLGFELFSQYTTPQGRLINEYLIRLH